MGDGIVDEYHYVKPLGMSPKEGIVTMRYLEAESFAGGVWAAAKHLETFCRSVAVATGSNFTIKRRYVEPSKVRKMAEVHIEHETKARLDTPVYGDFDIVIVADFGHGFVTPEMIERMTNEARFLAINAQTNSANGGFNLITKYRAADYVVLDELEARLAAHDRDSPIEAVIEKLSYQKIVVTLGHKGAIGYDNGDFHRAEGLTGSVVDTMGAGDAFFCVTAPFAAAGASMPELLAIGNAAGAIKCGIVGHRKAVSKEALLLQL